MSRYIFVNLPVNDVQRSQAFFTALGFSFEPKYTGPTSACMIIDENILVLMLADTYFKTFTKKALCDTTSTTEVMLALSCDNRQRGERFPGTRRTTDLCTDMPSRIWMDIPGS